MERRMTVGVPVFETPGETDVVATILLEATPQEAYDAWKPEHLPKWIFSPDGWTMPVCEIDLQTGGEWRMVWRDAQGHDMAMGGKYLEVSEPHRVVSTEKWGGDWAETINSLTFEAKDGGTLVTSSIRYPNREAREKALATRMLDGMAESFRRLAAYVRPRR
jgi:uncharacterized protein YndB with AHSA1/START domain